MSKGKRAGKSRPKAVPGGAQQLPAPREEARPSEGEPVAVVLDALARELDLRPADVTGDVRLQADLGLSEDQVPQLLAAMGEALDVRFPDDFFDGVHTVAQLTAAVRVSLSPL